MGLKQLKTDYCCYIKRTQEEYTILIIWVDNFLAMSTNEDLNNEIEKDLNLHFKVKSLGQPNLLLGIKIHVGVETIKLSQSHYIDCLLDKYGLMNANPASTPMDLNVKLDIDTKNDEKEAEAEENLKINHDYAQLIGSLMYLALATCPDISYAVNRLAQFTSNPKAIHWTAVKRIF